MTKPNVAKSVEVAIAAGHVVRVQGGYIPTKGIIAAPAPPSGGSAVKVPAARVSQKNNFK